MIVERDDAQWAERKAKMQQNLGLVNQLDELLSGHIRAGKSCVLVPLSSPAIRSCLTSMLSAVQHDAM